MRVSAAISPCPNDVFIFAGLISGVVGRPGWEFDFDFQELETLNLGTLQGRWDLAKISYANWRTCAAGYRLLRCGGALGRGCGPLLLSNGAGWDPGATVLVPGEHTTANFLLDFHHASGGDRRDGGDGGDGGGGGGGGGNGRPLRKTFLPFDEIYRSLLGKQPCQGVVIHEMRFTYAADGLTLIRDLGAHWEEATGHPIPLGAMAFRKSLEADSPGSAALVEELIRASLRWSRAHPREALSLCREHAQSMSDTVLRSHIDLYVNDFSLDLGPEGDAAVADFLARQNDFRPGSATL